MEKDKWIERVWYDSDEEVPSITNASVSVDSCGGAAAAESEAPSADIGKGSKAKNALYKWNRRNYTMPPMGGGKTEKKGKHTHAEGANRLFTGQKPEF